MADFRIFPAAAAATLAPDDTGFAVDDAFDGVDPALNACCAAPRIASEGLLTPA
jgi:hypothetical protein